MARTDTVAERVSVITFESASLGSGRWRDRTCSAGVSRCGMNVASCPGAVHRQTSVLDDALRQRAEGGALAIARELAVRTERSGELDVADLGSGWAGIALALAHAATRWEGWFDEAAARALDHALRLAPATQVPCSLYGGLGGIAWVDRLLREDEADAFGSAIRQHLREAIAAHHHRLPGALVEGAAGICMVAVELGDEALTGACVDVLLDDATHTDSGTAWLTRPEHLPPWKRAQHPDGLYDLGVAHGIPGIVASLAAAGCSDRLDLPRRQRVRLTVDAAFRWLRTIATPDRGRLGCWMDRDGSVSAGRLGWCYGDLGAGVALLRAAGGLDLVEHRGWAIEVLHAAAEHPGDARSTGICHGLAGQAHLFDAAYRCTGSARLGDAAARRFDALLDRIEAGDLGDESGFLEGAAGIGLVLMAACDDQAVFDPMLGCARLDDLGPSERNERNEA